MIKVITLFLILILTQQTFAAIYSDESGSFVDPRKHVDKAKWQKFNAIGFLNVYFKSPIPDPRATPKQVAEYNPEKQYMGIGTAFLIDECHIITNDHVAYQMRKGSDIKINYSEFTTGPNNEFKSRAKTIARGEYMETGDNRSDWAILKLETHVYDSKNKNDPRKDWKLQPNFSKLEDISYESIKDPGNLISAAYYHDLEDSRSGKKLYAHLGCTAWDASPTAGLWRTDCAAIPGVSGSPVFAEKNKVHGDFIVHGLMTMGAFNGEEYKFPQFDYYTSFGNGMLGFSEMKEKNGKKLTQARLTQILNSKENRCNP